jgi:predicted AlkP superfamily phosphohydrolase/phosphomutase
VAGLKTEKGKEKKEMNEVTSPKVLVIGLDGATFKIIRPLIKKGRLPTISRLIETGSHGVLRSTIPDLSPVAWTSMITGMQPGKHSIFDFVSRQPNTYSFKSTKGGDRKVPPIWSLLSASGKRVGIINVTMSYPPQEINGFMVSGLDSPGLKSNFTFPASLYSEITEKLGKYLIVNPHALTSREKHLQGMFEMIDNRLATIKYLIGKYACDFFMAVFIATDGAQHFYWKDMDPFHPDHDPQTPDAFKNAVYDVYAKIDKGIGELLGELQGEVTVFLVSDHGFQPLHKLFILNNWLQKEGYLSLKQKGIKGNAGEIVSIFLKKIKKKLGLRKLAKLKRREKSSKLIDWSKTRAFSDGTYGYVYINLKGRESQGVVEPGAQYEEICDEITRRLKAIRDPDNGQPVVDEVFRRDAIFKGPYKENAPDLIVTSKPNYFVSATSERLPRMHGNKDVSNEMFQKHTWTGNHEPEGIFIACGPNIRKGHKIDGAEIIDIAPTVLYSLDQEIPYDMDGKVLLDVFRDEYRLTHRPKVKYVQLSYDHEEDREEFLPEEDELIKERLRSLGYLE